MRYVSPEAVDRGADTIDFLDVDNALCMLGAEAKR